MKITEINIELIKNKDGLIGFASLIIDNNFFVSSIGIHQKLNEEGYRLTYPTKKIGDKIFNICYPININSSKEIEFAIFEKLKNVMKKRRT